LFESMGDPPAAQQNDLPRISGQLFPARR